MKIKQITFLVMVPALLLSFSLSLFAAPAKDVYALTKTEKKACYNEWAGRTLGSAGDGKKFNEDEFNKNKCSSKKSGSCKVIKYSDGAAIHCQRADGKYDNGSAGYGGTTGGTGTPGSGDKGKDTDTGTGDCGGVETAIIKCNENNQSGDIEDNGVWGLLLITLNIMTAGVGILAVGGIVYASILYTTAEDNSSQTKKAIDIITNVVIGLVAYALMWAGLNFLIPGGIFG